jgi:hypothetical protein
MFGGIILLGDYINAIIWLYDNTNVVIWLVKNILLFYRSHDWARIVIVPDPGKGVCADPVNGGAILGKGGPDPRGGNKERQLSPDKGRVKT